MYYFDFDLFILILMGLDIICVVCKRNYFLLLFFFEFWDWFLWSCGFVLFLWGSVKDECVLCLGGFVILCVFGFVLVRVVYVGVVLCCVCLFLRYIVYIMSWRIRWKL